MSDTNTGNPLKELEDLYKNKDYEGYKNLLIKNKDLFVDAQYFYNLGTAYLKLEDIGAARLNLEKSYKLGQQDKLVTNNINYIKSHYDLVSQDVSFVAKAMDIPTVYFTSFSLILLIITLIFNLKTKLHKAIIFSFFLISLTPLIFSNVYLKGSYKNAIVMKNADIFEGPSAIFEHNQIAKEGLRVITSKKNDNWFFIYWPSEAKGWIKAENIEFY
ncbi:hypothetical protein M902_1595 [Bacteriovorax sp. BAL6_X]|uniref:tetratricopeptide repeat protein n=1 Tax=Bacteriovorax sp. BAL6_X TaxID=1201290 RepID=UPI0003857013|nr:hypothetical protein [Bacteriovorax sp. BAL6_X]EPZ50479.1 hypothetical protein M902_1595 [Bacteriovorax sp. BAL6_X]